MNPHEFVPSGKSDVAAAQRALAAGWPAVEPVIDSLLEWIQDMNWSVAPTIRRLLETIGAPLADHVRPILAGADDIWKYNVIKHLLTGHDVDPLLVSQLGDVLSRVVDQPTPGEILEEVPEVARQALHR